MSRVEARTTLSNFPEAALMALITALRNLDDDDGKIVIEIRAGNLRSALETEIEAAKLQAEEQSQPSSWRERLWVAHPDTRLTVMEAVEALGRSRTWVYRHVKDGTLPHRRLHLDLFFTAGDLRTWLKENECVIVPGSA